MHINNAFKEELDKESNMQKMYIANSDKPVAYYSLDVVTSVGYRVKSNRGVEFRKWANSVLKQYILQGYAVNHNRIAQLGEVIKIMKRTQNELDSQQVLNVIQKYSKALELFEITSASQYCKTKISKNSTMNRIFPSINLTQINILHTYTYPEDGFIIERNQAKYEMLDE